MKSRHAHIVHSVCLIMNLLPLSPVMLGSHGKMALHALALVLMLLGENARSAMAVCCRSGTLGMIVDDQSTNCYYWNSDKKNDNEIGCKAPGCWGKWKSGSDVTRCGENYGFYVCPPMANLGCDWHYHTCSFKDDPPECTETPKFVPKGTRADLGGALCMKMKGKYCGVRSCNMFGCSCNGGCIQNSCPTTTPECVANTIPAPYSSRNRRHLLQGASNMSDAMSAGNDDQGWNRTINFFKTLDTNGNCKISFKEFLAWFVAEDPLDCNAGNDDASVEDQGLTVFNTLAGAKGHIHPKQVDSDLAHWKCKKAN